MPKHRAKSLGECPAQDCQGGRPNKQRALYEGELKGIPDSDRKIIEENSSSAFRCTYCGCVYLRGIGQNTVLGNLDGGVSGDGWRPSKRF